MRRLQAAKVFVYTAMNFLIASFSLISIMIANSSADHRNSTRSLSPDEPDKTWKIESSACHHKDYRTYVKCLQSHRRHEYPPQATSRGTPGGGVSCMDECERDSCMHQSSGPCVEVCYERCLKKTKEIHHRITEYESTCGEGEDCDRTGKSGPVRGLAGIANLTTSIDIRNYLNNTNLIVTNPQVEDDNRIDRGRGERRKPGDCDNGERNNTRKSGQDGSEETKNQDGKRGSEIPRRPLPPGYQPWYPGPSLALIPQIQMVPQVTFGLGIGPGVGFGSIGGGCAYASIWLCLPQQQQQQQQQLQQQAPDCEGCGQPYPYQRGRCDPSC